MNFARTAAIAALATALTAIGATAKPVTTTGETNLRKGPGTDNEVLTLIPKGTMVEVGECKNDWCQVTYNGQDGYAIARNLGMGPPRPPRAAGVGAPGPGYGAPVEYGPPIVVGPPGYYGYPYGPYYRPYWGWRRWYY